jgi:AraC-like DNA-binding protein
MINRPFSGRVLGHRLGPIEIYRVACGDLADPAFASRTIASVAASWGFADPARFSRAFRLVYGCSPTEARAVATMPRLDSD